MQAHRSIGRKLGLLALLSVAVAVVIGTAFALTQETRRYVEAKSEAFIATAQVFAAAVADAAAAGDEQAALRAMRAIASMNGMLTARIETAGGAVLASIGLAARLERDARLTPTERPSAWTILASGTIETTVPIHHNGRDIGQFVMVAEANDLLQRLLVTLAVTLAGAVLAIAAGLAVARRLGGSIVRPITGLTTAMQEIRERHDFSSNVAVTSDDEVGAMVEGFNGLLAEIRARDARLAEHLRDLERQVADRTADFRAARDAAERANRAKSDFLAAMSHEIRTPMNGMMVMAELVAGSALDERPKRHAQTIVRSGRNLLTIINDILDLSKIEAGQLTLEEIAFDPAEIIDQTVALFAERAREKGLELCAFIDPALSGTITGDPVRVQQVVANLVNNAVKFTESGSVLVVAEAVEGPAPALRISVADTGIGIPADTIGTLFTAFSQADQSITRRFGGTGLGLAICRKIADAMGATVSVESTPGAGSTFTFTLPTGARGPGEPWPHAKAARTAIVGIGGRDGDVLALYLTAAGYRVVRDMPDATADVAAGTIVFATMDRVSIDRPGVSLVRCAPLAAGEDQQGVARLDLPVQRGELRRLLARHLAGEELVEASAPVVAEQPRPDFGHVRILVADDSAVNREVALAALAHFGATADCVEDGLQAVKAVAGGTYDLVFMDGSMPVVDGFEASRRIRAEEAARGVARIPIVALTADVIGTAGEAWRTCGMDDLLLKPFSLDDLAAILRRWAPEGSAPALSAATPRPPLPEPGVAPAASDEIDLLAPAKLTEFAEMASLGRPDFAQRILGLWKTHAGPARIAVDEAMAAGDHQALGRAAHSLKSMSLNAGAARVAAFAGRVETIARIEGRLPEGDLIAALGTAVDATAKAIDAHLAGTPAESAVPVAAMTPPPPATGGSAPADTFEGDLLRAIEAGEIQPYFQPIMSRGDTRLVGVEALARWVKPDGTTIGPGEFIARAEACGLIVPLGSHMLKQSILCARDWPGINLSVNVSPLQLQEEDFEALVMGTLAETGFAAADLTLEVTETALIGSEECAAETLKRLRERGIGVALDDFGTGYSSLAYLRRFPFSRIKIDRSFIAEVDTAMDAAAIVHAVVAIGRSLGLKVVAEGIETEAQERFVSAAGVHMLQGYRYGRPMPAQDIASLVATPAKAG
jgi:EAL domain-containing protein (putative c-di-GMP-specific phosphodiesterase class I)/signal transduction histidine kinase/DNA-binding NarL/FixJ family response regulator